MDPGSSSKSVGPTTAAIAVEENINPIGTGDEENASEEIFSDTEPKEDAEETVDVEGLQMAARLMDINMGRHYAFFKTLTENDVTVESLRISLDQATLMFASFSRESFKVRGRGGRIYTRVFEVKDGNWRTYHEMKFVGYLGKKVNRNTPARITCEIKGQWREFVEQHRLRKGDDVYIYRYLLGGNDQYKFVFEVVHNGGN